MQNYSVDVQEVDDISIAYSDGESNISSMDFDFYNQEYKKLLRHLTPPPRNKQNIADKLIFWKQMTENKKQFIKEKLVLNEMKECTFQPQITESQNRRNVQEFLADQEQYIQKREQKLREIRQNLLQKEQEVEQFKVSKGSQQLLNKKKSKELIRIPKPDHIGGSRSPSAQNSPNYSAHHSPSHSLTVSPKSSRILSSAVERNVEKYLQENQLSDLVSLDLEQFIQLIRSVCKPVSQDIEINAFNFLKEQSDDRALIDKTIGFIQTASNLLSFYKFSKDDAMSIKFSFKQIQFDRKQQKHNHVQAASFTPTISPLTKRITKNRKPFSESIQDYTDQMKQKKLKMQQEYEEEISKITTFRPNIKHKFRGQDQPKNEDIFSRLYEDAKRPKVIKNRSESADILSLEDYTFQPQIIKNYQGVQRIPAPKGWSKNIDRMRSAGRDREEKRKFLERGETGKPPRPRR